MLILFAAWVGICAVWLGLLIAQLVAKREGLILTQAPEDAAGASISPTVCVVIPARNEGAGIEPCLNSILRQDYPSLSVVVVDDRSDDDTSEVVSRFTQTDQRVRLERIDELPPGWLGKSHALWQATRRVEADWLLFVDADCTLEHAAVRTAVGHAIEQRVDLLTLWPRQTPGGFWEHMTIPLCAGIVALWFDARKVNDSASPSAFANGQFILVRRSAYERLGGHSAVRTAIIEDVPFAEHAKSGGLRCRVASGRNLFAVKMYDGYAAIRDGWARIYVGALRSGARIAISFAWLALGSLMPFVIGPWLAVAAGGAYVVSAPLDDRVFLFGSVCVLHLVLLGIVSFRFWGLGGCPRRYLLGYPVSVLVVMRILVLAWWWLMVRRSVGWRQTRYRIDRRGRIVF